MNAAQCEDLQRLLEQREAELDTFKEERRNKDDAINFLKMKIVSLQNQSRVANCVVRSQGASDVQMPEYPEDSSPAVGSSASNAAASAAAIAERDQRIDDLEHQLAQLQQESQRSARAVNRMLSGGAAWELEETRRRLADRDRELDSCRHAMEWQEREIQRISEQSASDLEALRQRFLLRDREVEELKRALEDLESNRREHHLEVELRQQSELNRRLIVQLQREELDAKNLRTQLQEAREEVSFLWKSLHESRDDQEDDEQAEPTAAGGPLSTSVPAPTVSPVHTATLTEVATVKTAIRSRKVETFLGEDLLDALVPVASPMASLPPRMGFEQIKGASPTAGAEAAAGDLGPEAPRANRSAAPSPKPQSRPAMPPGGAEAAAGDERPICEAADAGAGVARRGAEEPSYVSGKAEKFGSFALEGQEAIVVTAKEGCDFQGDDIENQKFETPRDMYKPTETVVLELPSTPELKAMLDATSAQEEPTSIDVEEPQSVCVTGGGALFSINFFDDNEDIAAKEAKRQRVTRQIERRRQAMKATAGAAAANGRTPPSASPELAQRPSGGDNVGSMEAPVERPVPQASPAISVSTTPPDRQQAGIGPVRLPLPSRESTGGSAAGSPRGDSIAQVTTPSMGSAKGSPVLSARYDPLSLSSPGVSCPSPANCSDAGGTGRTPTLHSKFEGLRDEMKRRRSERAACMSSQAGASQDAQELAEAVVAEANANSKTPVVQAQPSPPAAIPVNFGSAPGGTFASPAATSISVASLTAQAAVAAVPGAQAAVTASPALAATSSTAGDTAPAVAVPTSGISAVPASFVGSSSPSHSPRVLKANSAGPSPGERVIRTTAGGPERFGFERFGGLSGSSRGPTQAPLFGGDGDAGHRMGHGMPPSPSAQNSSPFFIPLSPSASPSPSPSSAHPAMPFSPQCGQASPSAAPSQGSHRHQPQRLRSVPQEHLSSARSNTSELDRCRRNTLSLSARSVTVAAGGGGSSRLPQENNIDASRAPRPGDVPGEMEPDPLHDAVIRFCMQRSGRYPLVRLSRGVYLYGSKKLVIAIHNDKLMVRIGGGFVHLESYLVDADRSSPPAASPTGGVGGTASFDPAPRVQGAGTGRTPAARKR